MLSPTFQVSVEVGESITGTGALLWAGPNTCASQNEIPYVVARVTPRTRTYRAEVWVNEVVFQPAPFAEGVATVVNVVPSEETWIL